MLGNVFIVEVFPAWYPELMFGGPGAPPWRREALDPNVEVWPDMNGPEGRAGLEPCVFTPANCRHNLDRNCKENRKINIIILCRNSYKTDAL